MTTDTWKRWVEAFWFLRGIAAAMTLVAFVPQFTDLSRFEFLRAFHALIVRWNDFASWIGGLIGALPFIPEFDATVVNACFFALSVGLPAGIAAMLRTRGAYTAPGFLLVLPLLTGGTYLGLSEIAIGREIDFWTGVQIAFVLVILFSFFVFALIELKGYARGLIIVVTFVLTMQVLYWVNTPWLTDQINATVESAMRESR